MVPLGCFFLNWTLASISFSFILATCGGGGAHTDTEKKREEAKNENWMRERNSRRESNSLSVCGESSWMVKLVGISIRNGLYISRNNHLEDLRFQWVRSRLHAKEPMSPAKKRLSGVCVCAEVELIEGSRLQASSAVWVKGLLLWDALKPGAKGTVLLDYTLRDVLSASTWFIYISMRVWRTFQRWCVSLASFVKWLVSAWKKWACVCRHQFSLII